MSDILTYRYEFHPNPNMVSIHVSERVLVDETYVANGCESTDITITLLVSILMGTRGVTEVSLRPYEIGIARGNVFTRDEVAASVLDRLVIWLKQYNHITSDATLQQLPTLRADIRATMCPDCERAMHDEMRESMREFDTLDLDTD